MKKTASQKFSEGPWFVYIIECENGSLYTGICKNLKNRFKMHSLGKGAKYTRINKPQRFVYTEEYHTHSLAFQREREIKRFSTKKKQNLCKQQSHNMIDQI